MYSSCRLVGIIIAKNTKWHLSNIHILILHIPPTGINNELVWMYFWTMHFNSVNTIYSLLKKWHKDDNIWLLLLSTCWVHYTWYEHAYRNIILNWLYTYTAWFVLQNISLREGNVNLTFKWHFEGHALCLHKWHRHSSDSGDLVEVIFACCQTLSDIFTELH